MHRFAQILCHALVPALLCCCLLPAARPAYAQDEPAVPPSVSFPGNYANQLGGVDWEPADPTVQATDEEGDGVWTLTATLPGGDYEFKVAINGSWDENVGLDGAEGGENISFTVPDDGGDVTFYYDRNRGEINLGINPPAQPADAALEQLAIAAIGGAAAGGPATLNEDGSVAVAVPPLDFRICVTGDGVNMQTPNPPTVTATEGNRENSLAVQVSATDTVTATEFVVLRSLVDGGYSELGRMPAEPGVIFADPGVANGTTYYYQVVAVGENGLSSAPSSTGPLIPHAPILSIVIDEPLVLQHTLSAVERSPESTAAVAAPGITEIAGAGTGLRAQIGWAPEGSEVFTWADGAYVTDNQGGANVYGASMLPETAGNYTFAWRATTTGGREWTMSENRGRLTVYPAADTEVPKPPFRLDPIARSGSQISFAWRVSRPADLHNFRVCRAEISAGESGCGTRIDVPKETNVYTDTAVTAGSTYTYTVQTVDTSFNVSEPSTPITLTAELSIVDVTWRVLVPAATPPRCLAIIYGGTQPACRKAPSCSSSTRGGSPPAGEYRRTGCACAVENRGASGSGAVTGVVVDGVIDTDGAEPLSS